MLLYSSNIVFSEELVEDEFKTISNTSILSKNPSEIDTLLNFTILTIEYPLSTIPIIVETEGYFIIELDVDDFNEIYVYISTAYEPVVEDFWLIVNDFWLHEGLWHINVSVPTIIPEELYNITVMINQGGKLYSTSQPRAVSIIKEFSDDNHELRTKCDALNTRIEYLKEAKIPVNDNIEIEYVYQIAYGNNILQTTPDKDNKILQDWQHTITYAIESGEMIEIENGSMLSVQPGLQLSKTKISPACNSFIAEIAASPNISSTYFTVLPGIKLRNCSA